MLLRPHLQRRGKGCPQPAPGGRGEEPPLLHQADPPGQPGGRSGSGPHRALLTRVLLGLPPRCGTVPGERKVQFLVERRELRRCRGALERCAPGKPRRQRSLVEPETSCDLLTSTLDLHCHSVVGLGTLTPQEVAARAKANGVELWSLTDHDESRQAPRRRCGTKPRDGLPHGTQISVTFAGNTVHIVGLGFNPIIRLLGLGAGRHTRRAGRTGRRRWRRSLRKCTFDCAYEGALKFGQPQLISRTHFARFLVEMQVCRDTNEAFLQIPHRGSPGLRAPPLGHAGRCRAG